MDARDHIRATMAANASRRLGAAFEVDGAAGEPAKGSIWIDRARVRGRLVCRLAGAEDSALVLRPKPPACRPAAAAALLCSRLVGFALAPGPVDGQTLVELPWPEIDRLTEVQLEVLWRRFETASSERAALIGAFDRIAAELYALDIDDLMIFERAEG